MLLPVHGGWYPESTEFLEAVLHRGDYTDSRFVDVERFDHHSRTWASREQGVFLKQAVACMAASGQHQALQERATRALAAEGGGRAAGGGDGGAGAGVPPPSPQASPAA